MNMVRRNAPLAAWCVFLASALWVLHVTGSDEFPAPPLRDPGSAQQWLRDAGLADAIAARMRVAALILGWYLLAATIAGSLSRASRSTAWIGRTDRFAPQQLRHILHTAGLWSAASLTLASTPIVALQTIVAVAPTSATIPAGVADTRPAQPHPPDPNRLPDRISDAMPVLRTDIHLEEDAPPAHDPAGHTDMSDQAPDAIDAGPGPTATTDTWTVEPGDHFWSIAAAHLGDNRRAPSADDVATYWHRLIEANRGRLVVATNPDLLYPGQLLVLPPANSSTGSQTAQR